MVLLYEKLNSVELKLLTSIYTNAHVLGFRLDSGHLVPALCGTCICSNCEGHFKHFPWIF